MPRRPRGFFFLAEDTDMSKPNGSDLDMKHPFASRSRQSSLKRRELKGAIGRIMDRSAEIRSALEAAFEAEHIEVIDESEDHRGHSGYMEGGQSHFRVRLKVPAMATMSRLQRHRAVHGAIGADLMGRIHALALDIET